MNYTLIIAEKPSAAERIAAALDINSKAERKVVHGVPYFVAKRKRKIIVASAIGHLYTVAQKTGKKSNYPVWDFKWTPRYLVERGAKRTRQWIDAISELALDADTFIDACDYDIEGSLIGYCILNYACDKASVAGRMRFSTMTKVDLVEAYEHLSPQLDFSLVEAGKTRHEIDWLYGINLTRALTFAVKSSGKGYAMLSTGRVQGPTLQFLVSRENAINSFVPLPFWSVKAQVRLGSKPFEARFEKDRIETQEAANSIVQACKGKIGRIQGIEENEIKQDPPFPFDLGTLQREAYRLFKLNPRQTSQSAERLYLKALISYPRTSSQKLPPSINYKSILTNLKKKRTYQEIISELTRRGRRLQPREGAKQDPAHPAIYPTGNLPNRASKRELKIWDLIARRFMATFGQSSVTQATEVTIEIENHIFRLSGHKIVKEGWMRYYKPYLRLDEVKLPQIEENEAVNVEEIICERRYTRPPSRYNPSSLLRLMEQEGIGTKATRADVIQTLYDRRYIEGGRIKVTDLGYTVEDVLTKYAPTVLSTNLTRELETRIQQIRIGKEKGDAVIKETIEGLKPELERLKEKKETIGHLLGEAVSRSRIEERTFGACPSCGTGTLTIIRSRKTGKRFLGCSNYFKAKCKTSFPLPQQGSLRPTGKTCQFCGYPTVSVSKPGRFWMLCPNLQCPARVKGLDKR